jgi:hypothetical protein
MKTLLILIAAISITFFASCEEGDVSLNNTRWYARKESGNYLGYYGWKGLEIAFTSTRAIVTYTTEHGVFGEPATGRYTYNPPSVIIELPNIGLDGIRVIMHENTGTIKGKTMKIKLLSGDIVETWELKKQ